MRSNGSVPHQSAVLVSNYVTCVLSRLTSYCLFSPAANVILNPPARFNDKYFFSAEFQPSCARIGEMSMAVLVLNNLNDEYTGFGTNASDAN